ncbi:MAG: putative anti-sigma regulatory factor, serine/threonine protein kinase [Mycobacterium sp.]|jgi:anti-sigma regulatory factor (Ser/Thr protein kinase)|nr:putative anti-sigma regulatory factor, serine/threonine protein kinase [Mycobacterium sp.]
MIDSLSKADVFYTERFERIGVTADPRTAARTRDEFARWLHGTFDIDPHRTSDLVLAIYEALANIAEFAYLAAGMTGTMDVTASYEPTESALSVTVADRGLWRTAAPNPADRSRGRGIALMKALADRASIQTSTDGTTVRLAWDGVRPR